LITREDSSIVEYFKEIINQPAVKNRFIKSIANRRLAHAYLFYGPEGSGKESFALEIAKALNCQDKLSRPCNHCSSCSKITQLKHPDIKFIFPEATNWTPKDIQNKYQLKAENPYSRIELSGSTSISISKIRELKNEAKFTPYEAEKKVYIISEADKMTRESANSFLKLLEEPPDTLIIILITTSLNRLLDTIKSRCHIVYFPPLSLEEVLQILSKFRDISEQDRKIVQISQGNLKQIFDIIEQDIDEKRQMVYDFLKASATGNALKLQEAIDSMAKKRDKNFLLDILNLLILWFKDAIHLVSSGAEAQIVNIDFKEEVIRFAENYPTSDFEGIVIEIEKAIANLRQNVYSPILLTVLGIQIKKRLTRVRQSSENLNVT
jgi:DNA polymerase-3 subunit delta'